MRTQLLSYLVVPLLLAAACGGSSAPEATATPTPMPSASASVEPIPALDQTLSEIEARTSEIRGLASDDGFSVQFTDQAGLAEVVAAVQGSADAPGALEIALGLGRAGTTSDSLAIEGGGFISNPPTIFVVGSASDGLDEREISVYVHEYMHYLQSATFGVLDLDPSNVDAQFAQVALREGDAVRVEQEYQRRYLELRRPEIELVLGEEMRERFDQALTLLIYGGGAEFVSAVGGVGSSAVDRAFTSALTTEQVIHPEKFESGEIGRAISEDALIAELGLDAATIIDRVVLGEFFYLAWLTSMGSQSAFSAASGWNGDLAIVAAERDGFAFALRIEWDDPASDVAEFDAALRSGLASTSNFRPMAPGEFEVWQGPGGVLGFGTSGGTTTIIVAPTRGRTVELLRAALGP